MFGSRNTIRCLIFAVAILAVTNAAQASCGNYLFGHRDLARKSADMHDRSEQLIEAAGAQHRDDSRPRPACTGPSCRNLPDVPPLSSSDVRIRIPLKQPCTLSSANTVSAGPQAVAITDADCSRSDGYRSRIERPPRDA